MDKKTFAAHEEFVSYFVEVRMAAIDLHTRAVDTYGALWAVTNKASWGKLQRKFAGLVEKRETYKVKATEYQKVRRDERKTNGVGDGTAGQVSKDFKEVDDVIALTGIVLSLCETGVFESSDDLLAFALSLKPSFADRTVCRDILYSMAQS